MAMNEKEDKGSGSTVEKAAMLTAFFVGTSDAQLTLLFVVSLIMIVGGSFYLDYSYLAYTDSAYDKFASLLYIFTNYARENRFTLFLNQIQDSLISKYDRLHYISTDITIAVCVLQILILCILILVLLLRSKEIRRIMKLFSFVNPTVVPQNSHIMGVLTTGRFKTIGDNNNFRQAEKIIEKTTEGVLLCTKDLVISNVNTAFMKLVGLPS